MNSILTLLLSILLLSGQLSAQTPSVQNKRFVEAWGDGEMMVPPNELALYLGVETRNMDLKKAKRENDKRVDEILEIIKKAGIEDRHVQTDMLNVEPQFDYRREGRVNMGFVVRKNITITLRDLTKLEDLTTDLLGNGVTNVYNFEYRNNELRKYRDDARVLALKAAKEKAAAMAAQLDQKIGDPLSIIEQPSNPIYYPRERMANMSGSADATVETAAAPVTFAPGRIAVKSSVRVTFELQ